MKKIIKLIVNEDNDKKRIDSFIAFCEKRISRTKIKDLIENGFLKINNLKIIDASKKIKLKDEISLEIPKTEKFKIKPYQSKIDILYEDNDVLIINKPTGLVVHPGAGNKDKTLVNILLHLNKKNLSSISGELRPGIVHRLDKDTSGLLVIAKNNFAHMHISEQFNKHSIDRKYVALVWGKLRPQTGTIKTFITRSNRNRKLMEASQTKGKHAITNYKTIEVYESEKIPTISLVECKLETGRTHQIRVHMKYKGNSIVGDQSYKKNVKKFKNIDLEFENIINNLSGQCLHAKSLGFIHPSKNKHVFFESKLPNSLLSIVKKLRKLSS